MKIVPIFVNESNPSEGLFAIHHKDVEEDEFNREFDSWNDYNYILNFCLQNKDKILDGFYGENTIESFVDMIISEASLLENEILTIAESGFALGGEKLQTIFKPLNNGETSLPVLQSTKASIKTRECPLPKLRLYALRVDANTFIVTGGAIKITRTMS